MDPRIVLVIAAVVIVVLILALIAVREMRTAKLKSHFGPEYERAAREVGPQRAEAVLLEREKRVEKFRIRDLSVDERERYLTEWRVVQERFVDDPQGAVIEADLLVDRLMQTRGYPVADFEQRAADLSVSHPRVVDNYRAARRIALRHREGRTTTEDLRNAIIYYRSLFDELLHTTSTRHTREVA
jgi:hypothetical protein